VWHRLPRQAAKCLVYNKSQHEKCRVQRPGIIHCAAVFDYCLCIHSVLITSAEEGGYVFGSVCLSVCLSVRRITRKLVNGF